MSTVTATLEDARETADITVVSEANPNPTQTIYISPTGSDGAAGTSGDPTNVYHAFEQRISLDPYTATIIRAHTGDYTLTRYVDCRRCPGGLAGSPPPLPSVRSPDAIGGWDIGVRLTLDIEGTFGDVTFKCSYPTNGNWYSGHGTFFRIKEYASKFNFESLIFSGYQPSGAKNPAAYHPIFAAHHSHHVRMTSCHSKGFYHSGALTGGNADYLATYNCKIWDFGPGLGNDNQGSGVNYNWNQGCNYSTGVSGGGIYDTKPGFHHLISNCVIKGGYSGSGGFHQDGNGIILDLGGQISPILVIGNIIYMNGGRGIHTRGITGKAFILYNTLYKNTLDLGSSFREMTAHQSANQVRANNIIHGWNGRPTYYLEDRGTDIYHFKNAWYGTGCNPVGCGTDASDAAKLFNADPMFNDPPALNATADGQWDDSPNPDEIGTGPEHVEWWSQDSPFALQAGSTLKTGAYDITALPLLDPVMLNQLKVFKANLGGTGESLGAIQYIAP